MKKVIHYGSPVHTSKGRHTLKRKKVTCRKCRQYWDIIPEDIQEFIKSGDLNVLTGSLDRAQKANNPKKRRKKSERKEEKR